MIAPRTEINLYIKNVNNQDNKNYFLERERDFEKIFPQGRNLLEYENKKDLLANNVSLEKIYNNNLILFQEKHWRGTLNTYIWLFMTFGLEI